MAAFAPTPIASESTGDERESRILGQHPGAVLKFLPKPVDKDGHAPLYAACEGSKRLISRKATRVRNTLAKNLQAPSMSPRHTEGMDMSAELGPFFRTQIIY
jgi:hypothetical protein